MHSFLSYSLLIKVAVFILFKNNRISLSTNNRMTSLPRGRRTKEASLLVNFSNTNRDERYTETPSQNANFNRFEMLSYKNGGGSHQRKGKMTDAELDTAKTHNQQQYRLKQNLDREGGNHQIEATKNEIERKISFNLFYSRQIQIP